MAAGGWLANLPDLMTQVVDRVSEVANSWGVGDPTTYLLFAVTQAVLDVPADGLSVEVSCGAYFHSSPGLEVEKLRIPIRPNDELRITIANRASSPVYVLVIPVHKLDLNAGKAFQDWFALSAPQSLAADPNRAFHMALAMGKKAEGPRLQIAVQREPVGRDGPSASAVSAASSASAYPPSKRGVGPAPGQAVNGARRGPPSRHGPHGSYGHTQRKGPYVADPQDLLDQHVAWYLRHHDDVWQQNAVERKIPGVYIINLREVKVDWQHGDEDQKGFLVVLDGPLRQPFSRYMEMSEEDAEYTENGLQSMSIHNIPVEQRLSFPEQGKVTNRLEAMKIAKQQAMMREKAAQQASAYGGGGYSMWAGPSLLR